jgi:hypothetical protein
MLKRLDKRSLFVPLCVLLSWTAAAAQTKWVAYSDAELRVAYHLPANWTHQRRENRRGVKEIVGISPDGSIHLSLYSERARAGENIPSHPAQLKMLVEQYYKRLDAADNTQIDIKTRDIAVEIINNLRGVVIELTMLVPVKDKDGQPYLTKLAGFVLLAQGGGFFYRAVILCPLSKFTYNSVLMNRILNEVRAAVPANDALPFGVAVLNGVWKLSMGEVELRLEIAGPNGKLRVRYATAKGELVDIEEKISVRPTDQGFLLIGLDPTHTGTQKHYAGYAPEELFFQRQETGGFKVWIRDNVYVKEWTPLSINSYP